MNEELFRKNRQAVKKYLKWREQRNREEAEEPEEMDKNYEVRLELISLTCK